MCLLPKQGKLMQTTLRCLQKVVHNITNIYTEALLAYAFALAGDYETTQELLYKLEEQAIKSGAACWDSGLMHTQLQQSKMICVSINIPCICAVSTLCD